jgi:NADH dehydrogenase
MFVLVTGATGFIGTHTVRRLRERNYSVRAFVRRNSHADTLLELGAEVYRGDVRDLRALATAAEEVNVVVHLAGASSTIRDRDERFEVNVVGTQNVVDACRVNGVRRLVFVGSQADNTGGYAQTKRAAEDVAVTAGLDVTVVSPSLVFGPGTRGMFAAIDGFVRRFPVIPIVGDGQYPLRPIYVEDVAEVIVRVVERLPSVKKVPVSGRDVVTFEELVDAVMESVGVRRRKIHVPYLLAYISTALLSRLLSRFPLTVDSLRGLTHPQIFGNEILESEFQYTPLGLREGLRKGTTDGH